MMNTADGNFIYENTKKHKSVIMFYKKITLPEKVGKRRKNYEKNLLKNCTRSQNLFYYFTQSTGFCHSCI